MQCTDPCVCVCVCVLRLVIEKGHGGAMVDWMCCGCDVESFYDKDTRGDTHYIWQQVERAGLKDVMEPTDHWLGLAGM